jgi:hypothetical protein
MEADRFPELPTTIVEGARGPGLDQLNRIVLKGCALDPRQRYASAGALRTALAELQQRLPSGQGS